MTVILDAWKTAACPSVRAVTIGHEPDMLARLQAVIGPSLYLWPISSDKELDGPPAGLVVFLSSASVPWPRVREVVARALPVLIVARQATDEDEQRAFEAGAIGYVGLDAAPSVLTRAIEGALRGQPVFRRRSLGRWLWGDLVGRRRVERLARLTRRQRQVASLLTTGAADKEIAATLGIRVATVQKHVSNLLKLIGATNRAAAVWLILGGELTDRF